MPPITKPYKNYGNQVARKRKSLFMQLLKRDFINYSKNYSSTGPAKTIFASAIQDFTPLDLSPILPINS